MSATEDYFARQRKALMDEIVGEFRLSGNYTGRREPDPRTMEAMNAVPREEFVLPDERDLAYYNRPLSIGYGQTISQPFIVALMTDMLEAKPDHVALEVGAGRGYQAAVLSRLVRHVYTIEFVPELAEDAAKRLERLGYDNVTVRAGDGSLGWPEHAPYDRIIVTAAGPHVPDALIDQLAPNGRMVIPVGQPHHQDLVLVSKNAAGKVSRDVQLPVAFVPLMGEG